MAQTEVLIVGAGPSGLVLALCLHRLGVAVRIVDAASGPGTTRARWWCRPARSNSTAPLGWTGRCWTPAIPSWP
nr:FAD-dependent monooxygenase [Massilia sp. Dwa41.01b]